MKALQTVSSVSLIALIFLCVAWELWLAPLHLPMGTDAGARLLYRGHGAHLVGYRAVCMARRGRSWIVSGVFLRCNLLREVQRALAARPIKQR